MPASPLSDEALRAQIAAYAMRWAAPDFKSARVHAKLTQQQVAERAGITQARLSRFEAGRAKLTREETMQVIEAILSAQE